MITELDAYFDQVPLFVPHLHLDASNPATREEELRRGRVLVGGNIDVADMQEKRDVEHLN
ncbi:hypothetical protein EUX98_g1414 [Antrodiella citrinella]|uniref:Uncharacterized protein n=1 Tax=Antrodiella citrinella TaxID=2447956 RepID=A0A4S4N1L7_9APHY|nr:hypothetical protein EUX98_g1414 [Antrodiella citrinella]